ncbi:MAG: hypothetical protein GTO51_08285 [Candidatus Latescibacteria bacterium]|nr:hypothetical protein [Candidatus Latescibacterota bacterium]NIM21951.1 hypothetical protein [Candidatus Latescibacterota bacterium]NIM65969.1 hypothetical protein [Candidatus Latescibacterota bacterium]NIO02377.1 hypothetical protein [Candidatus Latescibacterota bacterium]NIO29287.1 hypothetical protein [Candidatus Latescibacterota bacterium]
MYDAGFSLGGPIEQDKLWYYLAYNPTFSKEEVEIPGLGMHDYDGTSHRFATKLTWQLDRRNDLEFSVFGDPTKFEGVTTGATFLDPPIASENPDPLLREIRRGGVNTRLKGRHWLHDNFLLQSTISAVWRKDSTLPLTERGGREGLFIDTETGIWSGGSAYDQETESLVATLGVQGTLIWDDNIFKIGFEYREVKVDYNDHADFVIRFPDPVAGELYRTQTMSSDGTIRNRIPSAFVQESQRMGDGPHLNLGLRWDGQYIFSEGDVAQRFTGQWQPRAGFTYRVGERGRHQLFGSYGRFYQELSMAAPALYFMPGAAYRVIIYDHDPRVDPVIGPGDTLLEDYVGGAFPETEGLEGQHYDEFTLGYEHQLTRHSKAAVRGIYRALGNVVEDAFAEDLTGWVWGNPGSGDLSHFPRMKREYTALELIYRHSGGERYNFLVSYTLSRNYGNYPGLFPSDYGEGFPNASTTVYHPEGFFHATGLLPNDRTHVFKCSGSYRIGYGATALWQSGTPLSEFGASLYDPVYNVFIVPRGEAGRTTSIWDLSLRFTYDSSEWWRAEVHPKLILDLLHVGSRRKPISFVQRRFLERDIDGNHITPNPAYGLATAYQPPMAVRLGLEVDF